LANSGIIRIRRYLVAGLLIWLPIGVTVFVFRLLLGLMDQLLFLVPLRYRPEALLGIPVPGLGAALALIMLLVTGMLAANFFGRRLIAFYESLLAKIPFVRTVYSAVKNFAEIVLSDSGTSFKKVLLIEYPRKGLYSIVFQTSDEAAEVQAKTGETIITVFLPTTPNPTSGFMLFVPKVDTVELDMTVEEALKMVVSLGVVAPRWRTLHPDNPVARPHSSP